MVDEDFVNYKKPSMFISFPSCTFKCEAECRVRCCQNSALAQAPDINVSIDALIERYMNNPITHAVVCGGLEPMDSWDDLQCFILNFRYYSGDDIVIYTGYNKDEIQDKIEWLKLYDPVIIKYGRYIPGHQPHYDEVLGVYLASPNQVAEKQERSDKFCEKQRQNATGNTNVRGYKWYTDGVNNIRCPEGQ